MLYCFFDLGLLVIIKLTKRKFNILINIKYYLKTKNGCACAITHKHVGYTFTFRVVLAVSLDSQKQTSTMVHRALPSGGTCIDRRPTMWL